MEDGFIKMGKVIFLYNYLLRRLLFCCHLSGELLFIFPSSLGGDEVTSETPPVPESLPAVSIPAIVM
jgi:hypothetical protein